jgi:hypothetical protein
MAYLVNLERSFKIIIEHVVVGRSGLGEAAAFAHAASVRVRNHGAIRYPGPDDFRSA